MADPIAWDLPPLRDGHAADADLEARRARAAGVAPEGVRFEDRTIGGVRCLIVNGDAPGATILYFHGGGYRLGSPVAYLAYADRIARQAGVRIVMPFYRLAPEHPFPAALHDAVAVYRALAEAGEPGGERPPPSPPVNGRGAPGRSEVVLVGGDSAGGGLAAALCVTAHRAGTASAGAILVSPMLDFSAADDSYETNAPRDPLFSRDAVHDCARLYLQGVPVDDPLVSPLLAPADAFPPALILTGGAEVLLGEALTLARRLALADRPVTLHVAPGMGHVWPLMMPDHPESVRAVAAITGFVAELEPASSV